MKKMMIVKFVIGALLLAGTVGCDPKPQDVVNAYGSNPIGAYGELMRQNPSSTGIEIPVPQNVMGQVWDTLRSLNVSKR